jgi:gliding motility-associated-like protein
MKKKYLFFVLLLISQISWAQCPNLLAAMVNSCGVREGNNEFVIFTTSVTANASTYTLNYGTANPPRVNNLSGADATTPTGTGTVTTTGSCPVIQVTSPTTSIPAGSTVMFIPASFDQNYNVTSLCNGTSPIYVVFIKTNAAGGTNSNWSANGTLGNTPSTPRYLQVTYNGSTSCSGSNAPVRSYTAARNWAANVDGNIVFWNNGYTLYLNNGCSNISFQSRGDTTVTACSSFTWYGITYTASTNTPTYTTTGVTGNDSIVTLRLTINNPTTVDTTVTACSSFTWHGITYTSSTNTPTYTTTNVANCDSVVRLRLTINNGTYSAVTQSTCGSFVWHGTTYNTSGTYIYNYINSSGCNSADTLRLTIINGTYSAFTQSTCGSFVWYGTTYNTSGTYIYNYTNSNGCNSTDTLHLTISNSTSNSESQTSCEFYVWHGTTYSSSGIYLYSYNNGSGCSSEDTLYLTINNGTYSAITQSTCGSFVWNGTTYNTSGTYIYTYTNVNGCNSADTLHLTIDNGNYTSSTQSSCENYVWRGTSYNISGTYIYSYTNLGGCISSDTLYLTINKGTFNAENQVACNNYVWHGTTYNTSGTYIYNYANGSGCSSADTLHLTINTSNTGDTVAVACGNFVWYGINYLSTGTPTHVFKNVKGCDSIVTLHLTINLNDTSITRMNKCISDLPVLWNGNNYNSSGMYYAIFTASNGCDSIAKLILNVKNNSTSTTLVKVCANELPYRWNNQSFIQSGNYQYYTTNTAGCDSIATLVLTVFDECNDIVFPNAFTPDNDGLNDDWGAIGTLSLIYKYELFIYNRLGKPVFISYNPSEKWKGTFRNKKLEAGNFVWFATYTFNGSRRKQSGNLLLLK